jgi:hypothetical protein
MLTKSLAPLALLIVKQLRVGTELAPCLSYYGTSTTGKYSFYGSPDEDCVFGATSLVDDGGVKIVGQLPTTELVWLENEASSVDVALVSSEPSSSVAQFLANIVTPVTGLQSEGQQHIMDSEESKNILDVLHQDDTSMLLRVDHDTAQSIDTHLPRFWRSMKLSLEPQSAVPVPQPAVERVRDILKHVKFDPVVASIVNNISTALLKKDVRYLTGEDPKSKITTRHSFSDGARAAAEWLQANFKETGATCRLSPFLPGFAPNVIWYVCYLYLAEMVFTLPALARTRRL